MANSQKPQCKNLVLDAGPLLSLSPLRGLAETYLTVPQVLAELKDGRAREHFEKLGLLSGVNVAVKSPDAVSLSTVIQWAKKTGDYAVLSHADLCVLALTYSLHEEEKRVKAKEGSAEGVQKSNSTTSESEVDPSKFDAVVKVTEQLQETSLEQQNENSESHIQSNDENEPKNVEESPEEEPLEPLEVELHPIEDDVSVAVVDTPSPQPIQSGPRRTPSPIYDDPSDSDDGEGEWITPANVGLHKSRALDLLPDDGPGGKDKGKAKELEVLGAGCMTADFAMQNVLLQMGLNLVSVDGKRIEKVKSWVLRCHACFKICKDNSKKFCPSCGNPTLLRASVTVASPNASADAPVMQVHLKPNFQYKIRGTKYSIPAPKPGTAKTGPGEGLILREDQTQYMRAKKMADGKREREETRVLKGILGRGVEGNSVGVSSWMDPDWVPEILSVGSGGKGRTVRSSRMDGDLPQIGYGRKNPNEKRRHK